MQRLNGVGEAIAPNAIFNPDWDGKGVLSPFTYFTKHKWRWPTQTGRQQYYIDHPWFIEAREALPTHRESPKGGGDRPFQMISCHSRWSIHSTWRDTPLLLRLQRGEPVVYLNPKDAEQLGIADDGWSEIYNDYGKIFMLVKHSTMVRPGVAYYFHAWEPYQFPNHESYKWITPGPDQSTPLYRRRTPTEHVAQLPPTWDFRSRHPCRHSRLGWTAARRPRRSHARCCP